MTSCRQRTRADLPLPRPLATSKSSTSSRCHLEHLHLYNILFLPKTSTPITSIISPSPTTTMPVHSTLVDHHGLTVKVLVDGKALRKYIDPRTDTSTNERTTYIEVNRACDFDIELHFGTTYVVTRGVHVSIKLDGEEVDVLCLRKDSIKQNVGRHTFAGVQSKINGRWYTSRLRFQPLSGEWLLLPRSYQGRR